MKKSSKSSTKKTSGLKSAAVIKEYNERLGPVRRVVSMTRAQGTKAAYNLKLECKHIRRGTKRATVRCGRCK
jgi:hypothetical protein